MKKFLPCLILFGMFLGMPLLAEENSFTIGLHGLGGARYDNVRMCVGSPSGVPGGPIGEFYVDLRFPSGKDKTFIVNLPLFRPVYFAFAFDMLQLEPQVTLEYYLGTGGGIRPVVAWGAGAVFHYGPDYNSSPEAPGSAFFAVGPLVSGSAGLALWDGRIITGAKIFYAPLFSPDRPVGTVAGGALEVQFILDI